MQSMIGEVRGGPSRTEHTVARPEDIDSEDIDKPDFEIEDPETLGKCAECVKAVPVFEYKDLRVGDHISFSGKVYDHHAIVTKLLGGDKIKIVEATNTPSGAVLGIPL